ncbi:MAG: 5-carboxymethyl-2-hydroxymuconate isomerase [Verrucomicrobiales bacterium]|jgi:5-carboxymethyl-2-hydroxymuconate isomerase
MPHLIVEYTANVALHHDVDALLDALQESVLEMAVAPVPGVRIRAIQLDRYRIADNSDTNHAFIAMVARIGPGRDAATKTRIINTLLDSAEAQFATEPSPLIIAWSLEVQEIEAEFRVNRNNVATAMKNGADQ